MTKIQVRTIHFSTMENSLRLWEDFPCNFVLGKTRQPTILKSHSASGHKSCHLKFNNFKLANAKNKIERMKNESDEKMPTKRRALSVEMRFLCEKGV